MTRLAPLVLATAAVLAAAPVWAVPTSFTVTGQVNTPGTFDAARLGTLSQSTQSVTYTSAGRPTSDTFTGATLWSVLQAAGGITPIPGARNSVLRDYVVATGADGYQAVISAGEVSPNFGRRPDLIATSDTNNRLPDPDGFARVVAAGDVAGGRYVSNLVNLDVRAAPAQPGTGGGATTSFVVQGAVQATKTYTYADLLRLTPHTQTVTYTSGTTPVTDTYTGVYLWDVLQDAGLVLNAAVRNDVLRRLVTVAGSDGYQAAIALGEISPTFGNAPILVAYADTAGQLAGGAGFARLVVPGDLAGGRYVSNLASLTVFDGVTAVPEPMSLALLAVALGAVVFVRGGGARAYPSRLSPWVASASR